MLGRGVGIDYALCIVARYRENVLVGRDAVDAVGVALTTTGKSVAFAGGVVVTSLLGLGLMGIPCVGWLGVASAAMVAVAVLASPDAASRAPGRRWTSSRGPPPEARRAPRGRRSRIQRLVSPRPVDHAPAVRVLRRQRRHPRCLEHSDVRDAPWYGRCWQSPHVDDDATRIRPRRGSLRCGDERPPAGRRRGRARAPR